MEATSQTMHTLLSVNSTSFVIPPFQRSYAWGRNEIERFFNDIKDIVESKLKNERDELEHFFGTIFLRKEGNIISNTSIIIDGQQRITTTLLFLIALRDIETDENIKQTITNTYLINQNSTQEDKVKLKQSTKDWEAYRALIKNEKNVKFGIIKNAYDSFRKLITEHKNQNPQITADIYFDAINKLNLAVIILDNKREIKGEDPQIVFETLNSLGKPLSLSDLVRNYVLLNMKSDDQNAIYNEKWFPQIEKELGDYVSEFLRDFLQYKTSSQIKVISDNNTKEIYSQLKKFIDNNYENYNNFINDIVHYVKFYKMIIFENNNENISSDNKNNAIIKELLRNIFHDNKTEAFKPFVMGLLSERNNNNFSDKTLIESLKTILSYLVRRRILKTTNGENKAIPLLSKRIKDLIESKIDMVKLLSQQAYNVRFPNDEEVEKGLKEIDFYNGLKSISKFILGKIEENNTKIAVDFRSSKITIEHIMPQTLSKEWQKMLGANYEEIHRKYLHNIGNLILTEFNGEMSNKEFQYKQQKLKISSLNYRLEIIESKNWNEKTIKNHQKKMIKDILQTFSLPNEYQKTENWSENKKIETEFFSPLDNDSDEIAEGQKPKNMTIGDVNFSVKTWNDIFINFMNFIKNDENYGIDIILNNQIEMLGSENYVIIDLKELKNKIEEDEIWAKRYKTFSGEIYKNIEDKNKLKNDELFIHVNISARTCLSRIANIMNKLNMSSDFVKIYLNKNKQNDSNLGF